MDMKSLFQQIGDRFRRDRQEQLPDEVVAGFLRVLEEVRVEEMPCSEVFAKLDEYVDKEVGGEDAAKLMPLLREHFDLCPDCCDEYEALLACLEQSKRDSEAGAS